MARHFPELIGATLLTPSDPNGDDYFLTLPSVIGTGLPNSTANQVIEEVYYTVRSENSLATIHLPDLDVLNGVYNLKIYIYFQSIDGPGGVLISAFQKITGNDTINGIDQSLSLQLGKSIYLHRNSINNWMGLIA